MIAVRLEQMPKVGETIGIEGLRFTVLRADERQVRLLKVEKVPAQEAARKEE